MEMYEVPSNKDGDEHVYESEIYDDVTSPQERAIGQKLTKSSTHGFRKILLFMLCVVVFMVLFAIGSLSYFLHICMEKTDTGDSGKCLADNRTHSDVCHNGGTYSQKVSSNDEYECKCSGGYLGERCQFSDGTATDFLVIFQDYSSKKPTPKLLISAKTPARLSINNFATHQNTSVTTSMGQLEYTLKENVLTKSNGFHKAGVEIFSNVPISVYGLLFKRAMPGAFIAIPSRFASTKYIIPSFTTIGTNGFSLISFTPVHQINTIVQINLRMTRGSITYNGSVYSNKDSISVAINKYSKFQLSHNSDLSGTIINASNPVVIISGSTCNRINKNGGCNPFIEMVLPINQLDTLYVIPYVAKRINSTVRLLAVDRTIVTIRHDNRNLVKNLISQDYIDFFHTTISYVKASSPIMVQIYPHELLRSRGDAFMMTIQGVNQYLYDYTFMVPSDFESKISVTVVTKELDGFVLDGESLSTPSVYNITEENDKYSSFSIPISHGSHHLTHQNKIRFGLWVYGTHVRNDAYGYPAGIAYKTT